MEVECQSLLRMDDVRLTKRTVHVPDEEQGREAADKYSTADKCRTGGREWKQVQTP